MSRRMRVAVVSTLVLALLAIAAPALAAPTAPAVSGVVTGSDAQPIPGASVAVLMWQKGAFRPVGTLATDAAGHWTYSGKSGTYRFDVAASGADPASQQLVMENKQTYTLNVRLVVYGSFSGVIRDASIGTPIQGASVEIWRRTGEVTPPELVATLTTGPDGAYASGSLPAATYELKASAAGHSIGYYGGGAPQGIVITRDAALTGIDVSLSPTAATGEIRGTIYDTGYVGIHGFVYFYKQNPDLSWPTSATFTVESAWDGTYASGQLPFGSYQVRLFTVHTGVQWWYFTTDRAAATPVTLSAETPLVTGVNAWFRGATP